MNRRVLRLFGLKSWSLPDDIEYVIYAEGEAVEVPVEVDQTGFHPRAVGALPPELALLTQLSSGIEELAIQGSISGDPTMIYRAICHDPLTAAVLSLAEIKDMTNELFAQHKEFLPQFKYHQV